MSETLIRFDLTERAEIFLLAAIYLVGIVLVLPWSVWWLVVQRKVHVILAFCLNTLVVSGLLLIIFAIIVYYTGDDTEVDGIILLLFPAINTGLGLLSMFSIMIYGIVRILKLTKNDSNTKFESNIPSWPDD